MHSQGMASIAPIVIGCIDYQLFLRVMFRPKIKLDVFFPARKAADERCVPFIVSIRNVDVARNCY